MKCWLVKGSNLKCFVLQDFMKMVLKCSAAFTLQRGQLCQLASALSSASSWSCSGWSLSAGTSRLAQRGQNRIVPSSAFFFFFFFNKFSKALSSAGLKVSSLVSVSFFWATVPNHSLPWQGDGSLKYILGFLVFRINASCVQWRSLSLSSYYTI